jgi:hypothetical protein
VDGQGELQVAHGDVRPVRQARGVRQHAALVLRVMGSGIWVVDQWRNNGGKIGKRLLRLPAPGQQRNPDGSFQRASNNPLAFRVIE